MPPALLVLAQSACANADAAAVVIERVIRECRLPDTTAAALLGAVEVCLDAASEAQHVVDALSAM